MRQPFSCTSLFTLHLAESCIYGVRTESELADIDIKTANCKTTPAFQKQNCLIIPGDLQIQPQTDTHLLLQLQLFADIVIVE